MLKIKNNVGGSGGTNSYNYIVFLSGSCDNHYNYDFIYSIDGGMTWQPLVTSNFNSSASLIEYDQKSIIHCNQIWVKGTFSLKDPYTSGVLSFSLGDSSGTYISDTSPIDTGNIILTSFAKLHISSSICLTGDTLVTMADYSQKRIDEIELGDEILSYDWETMKLYPNKVIYTDKDENKSYKEYDVWTFNDGSVIKTVHRHEFYNVEAQKFKYMDEWKIGEHTFKYDGSTPELISYETIKEAINHYKITGENGTNYFANGLLTGDRYCPSNINNVLLETYTTK